MNILVTTSNNYIDKALRPFAFCFHKYWSATQPVTVLGANPPNYKLPKNFDFISVGDSWPVDKYSNVVINFLKQQKKWEYFIWLMDDFWLNAIVHLRGIEQLIEYMKQSPNIIRMDLTLDRAFSGQVEDVGGWRGFNLVKTNPPSPYQMSLQPALWNRRLLLDILIPDEDPWQIELDGTSRLNKSDYKVYGTKENPFSYTNALNSTIPGINLDGLSKDVVAQMVKYGWLRLETEDS